ncbi:MAG TPA: vanadium-dependent haloperoxidase [Longimicrobium sp.]|nr:vanadium-dependent haloperoxidase [Longimicrobium sp.]
MPQTHELVDTFSNDVRDSAKWNSYGSTVADLREVNGRLEVRPTGGASSSYAGYESDDTYDLTDSELRVEVVRALRAVPGTETYVGVETSDAAGNEIYFVIQNGRLYAQEEISGTTFTRRRVAYEPQRHRWLRIRELNDVVYWETSRDGETWELLVHSARSFAVTSLYAGVGAGTYQAVAAPGVAIFDNVNVVPAGPVRRVEERRLSAREVRERAAALAAARRHDAHANNNDETNYPGRPFIGSHSKSLKHDALGDPDPISYGTLLRALESRDPGDFEEIQLATPVDAPGPVKLTNPQSGLAFDVVGPDAQEVTMPPAPRFDSEVTAHEAGELYWMAVARDVAFIDWPAQAALATSPIKKAIDSLNTEFPRFGGTVTVTAQNLFRGIYPGEQVGPYVSQFLLKGNVDPRKPDGQGRDADEGLITYGSQVIDQRQLTAAPDVDHLTSFSAWLNVQNGADTRGQDQFDTTRRFIRSLRDGATYVHFDQVINAYYNAAMILLSEPSGNQLAVVPGTGRPMIDLEFTKDPGNPYDPPGTADDSRTQVGFGTFGPIHLLQLLSEVLGRAIRAVWWQKWGVHRRLRPEEYGGRVHNHVTGARTYPLHSSIVTSLQTGLLSGYFGNAGEKFPSSYLLPQAYPEGAPTHPAYGAGHATGSGACVTILKAFFNEGVAIENPVQSNATGTALVAYTGSDASQMTVGGELNKLAGNIALFRNAAGVHWRSDYTDSLPFGEAIAIRMLQEMSLGFNEDDAFFEITKFDGSVIRIADGRVVVVSNPPW